MRILLSTGSAASVSQSSNAPWRLLAGLHDGVLSAKSLVLHEHLSAAVDWIERARLAGGDGGISKGFDLLRRRWAPSYPETTGYTVPTLLNAALVLDRPALRALALSLADYLLGNLTPEGGVGHWTGSDSGPIVFDTGQVIFGWIAAYDAIGDDRYLRAAVRAGDWLVAVQDPSGSWKDHQHLGVEKVIDTRVAWALLELNRRFACEAYVHAAVGNLEWALRNQDADGWFRRCTFVDGGDPFTHTLAYTAEGLFECGCLLSEARYIDAASRTADMLLLRQRTDGGLASTYVADWRETSRSSCLTGDCQMGRLWLRMYEVRDDEAYLNAAERAIAYVASTQDLRTSSKNIRGAIAGSCPIYGQYERLKYPNWAAKFFADSLLTLNKVRTGGSPLPYVG
ncbi:MAG: terpene cyclase/mutase family protein [Chloroflexi bacterium]|nr:terpene cyclase/mutase family protein [Chloroflexota bacterium]